MSTLKKSRITHPAPPGFKGHPEFRRESRAASSLPANSSWNLPHRVDAASDRHGIMLMP
jgi:hypothetical protein